MRPTPLTAIYRDCGSNLEDVSRPQLCDLHHSQRYTTTMCWTYDTTTRRGYATRRPVYTDLLQSCVQPETRQPTTTVTYPISPDVSQQCIQPAARQTNMAVRLTSYTAIYRHRVFDLMQYSRPRLCDTPPRSQRSITTVCSTWGTTNQHYSAAHPCKTIYLGYVFDLGSYS